VGLFNWRLGKPKMDVGQIRESENWDTSENGISLQIVAASRTVASEQKHGWKYCIADISDEQSPLFEIHIEATRWR